MSILPLLGCLWSVQHPVSIPSPPDLSKHQYWTKTRVEPDPSGDSAGRFRLVLLPLNPRQLGPTGVDWSRDWGFDWLDDSGQPLVAERILRAVPGSKFPCFPARTGLLHAGIRPALDDQDVELCWVAEPGSRDTLRGLRNPYLADWLVDSGWRLDTTLHRLLEGWKLGSKPVRYRAEWPYPNLDFHPDPESIPWMHGASRWMALIDVPWYLELAIDTIPSHQDPNVVWRVEPSPLGSATFAVPKFGAARWTGRYRWRTRDSLVGLAMLACQGAARAAIGRDSLEIEVPVEWNPSDPASAMVPDLASGFRTTPRGILPWAGGRIATSGLNFVLDVGPAGMKFLVFKDRPGYVRRSGYSIGHHDGDPASLLVYMVKRKSPTRIARTLSPDFKLTLLGPGEIPGWISMPRKADWAPPRWGAGRELIPE